jgi:PhnB protein
MPAAVSNSCFHRYRNAIVPHIYVDGASNAIAFYTRAFGAVELFRIAHPNGKILHAEISICGSVIMIGDPDHSLYGEPSKLGGCTAGLHVFVDDNAALLRRAVEAGAEEIQKPTDMFYGANSASARDPFGHVWVLLSWKQDLAPAEMESRGNTLLARQASGSSERESIHPSGQSQAGQRTCARAKARITVQNSEAKPYDQNASPTLVEVRLTEAFTGDIEGESPVRALQVLRDDKSACLVSMQRFCGKLGGTAGHLRASRFRNRRQRQDQGKLACRSWIGHRGAFRVARRGRV